MNEPTLLLIGGTICGGAVIHVSSIIEYVIMHRRDTRIRKRILDEIEREYREKK